jgi:hypothetical protein
MNECREVSIVSPIMLGETANGCFSEGEVD